MFKAFNRRRVSATFIGSSLLALGAALAPSTASAQVACEGTGTSDTLNAEVQGSAAFACGVVAKAKGDFATAIGTLSWAEGKEATAIGEDSAALKEGATAVGYDSTALSYWSTAIGNRAWI